MTTPAASKPLFTELTAGSIGGTSPPETRASAHSHTLVVLSLSPSFSFVWPTLATECKLELTIAPHAAAIDKRVGTVGIIAAGGAEDQLTSAVLEMAGLPFEFAAVGSLKSHHLASSVVRAGAATYFALPDDYDLLRSWLQGRAERVLARDDAAGRGDPQKESYDFEGILGQSPALQATLERVARIIPHASVTVLLTGETGTGKELVARAIHYNGPRRDAPFVDVNCAAIPDQLLESELFGHEKGAFTDATVSKPGLFELAHGGTLLLDEVGHLPLPLQGKLLRALEERAVRRIGGTRAVPFDLRVIAATHVDLAAAVRRGEFREDLFHRLNVVPIALPPLRARREDIPGLARHFLARVAEQYGLQEPTLSLDAERMLASRDWTGNVRELRNLMERTLLLSCKESLTAEDFADETWSRLGGASAAAIPFPATLAEITRAAAVAMLDLCSGNKSDAARRLMISRSRLQRLLDVTTDGSSPPDDDSETNHE